MHFVIVMFVLELWNVWWIIRRPTSKLGKQEQMIITIWLFWWLRKSIDKLDKEKCHFDKIKII